VFGCILPDQPDREIRMLDNPYFKILGYKKEADQVYLFFDKVSKQVHQRTATALNKQNLLSLAPISFWSTHFPAKNRDFSISAASEWLIYSAKDEGVIDSDRFRGRGIWIDNDEIVIHNGDKLIVNGRKLEIGEYKSKYIYEAGSHLGFEICEPLTNEDTIEFAKLTSLINFEREIDRLLFIGWCVIAPVCGALRWRPHLWLTGKRGCGKSWILREVIRPMLGSTALPLLGETTSAGIRQIVKTDALNPVIDEGFKESCTDLYRLQDVISLARVASSDDGGIIAKGTVSQNGKSYQMRGCFALSSVTDTLQLSSDKSRFTVINIKEGNPANNFAELKSIISRIMDKRHIAKLHARTLKNLPVILRNVETLSTYITGIVNEARLGEQYGTLLAGAYSLYSEEKITPKIALEWLKKFGDWTAERQTASESDDVTITTRILDEVITISTGSGIKRKTVSELIQSCTGLFLPEVDEDLQRIGVRYAAGKVVIAYNHKAIMRILHGTGYELNYHKILLRIDEAESVRMYFSGRQSRAVAIPIEYFNLEKK